MQRYTELKVWQRAHALVLRVYALSATFPDVERFGLTSQLRRAVVSVPTNIAEGSRRAGAADYARFLNMAEGSLAESDYLVLLARDLRLLADDDAAALRAEIDEISRMLFVLRTKVEREGR